VLNISVWFKNAIVAVRSILWPFFSRRDQKAIIRFC